MKQLDLVALLLSTTLLLGLSQAASAENLCTADMYSEKGALDSSYDGFLSEKSANRDVDGLKDKLDAANMKLDQGKADDARQKIGDAMSKLNQMLDAANTPKAKISLDAYDEISIELASVLGCFDTYYK